MDLQVLFYTVIVIGFGLSVGLCFFGYALFRFFIAFFGFLVVGTLAGFLGYVATDGESIPAAVLIGLPAGLIGAWAAWTLHQVGVFLWGALVGALLSTLLFVFNDELPEPIVVIVVAIAGGVFAVAAQKAWIVVSTAVLGALGIVLGIGLWAAGGQMLWMAGPYGLLAAFGEAPGFVFFASWLAVTVVGVAFQYRPNTVARPGPASAGGAESAAAAPPGLNPYAQDPYQEPIAAVGTQMPARPAEPGAVERTAPPPAIAETPAAPDATEPDLTPAAALAHAELPAARTPADAAQDAAPAEPVAMPRPQSGDRRDPGGWAVAMAIVAAVVAIGVGAWLTLRWLDSGGGLESGDGLDGAVTATRFPAAFLGTWDDPEGCPLEDGTDAVMQIRPREIVFYESGCQYANLQVAGNRVSGEGRCEGEGEEWTDRIDLELVAEDMLIAREQDGLTYGYVRCAERPEPVPYQPAPDRTAASAPPAQGVVDIDGTAVAWSAPGPQEPGIAFFSFQMRGYENTYQLDCRYQQFRWVSNQELRTGRYTDNVDGAEWHPLTERSSKANAAFRAACP